MGRCALLYVSWIVQKHVLYYILLMGYIYIYLSLPLYIYTYLYINMFGYYSILYVRVAGLVNL